MKQSQHTLAAPHNVTLGYTEWGNPDAAQTIICVHGLTRNARDFDFLAKALSHRGARVIALNMVGRGTSSWLADPHGLRRSGLCRTCAAISEGAAARFCRLDRNLDGRSRRHAHSAGREQPDPPPCPQRHRPLHLAGALAQLKTYVGRDPSFCFVQRKLRLIFAKFMRASAP